MSARRQSEKFPVSPLQFTANKTFTMPKKVPLSSTPGCWRILHFCASKGGWTGTLRGGGAGGIVEAVPIILNSQLQQLSLQPQITW